MSSSKTNTNKTAAKMPQSKTDNPTLRGATDEQLLAEIERRMKADILASIEDERAEIVHLRAVRKIAKLDRDEDKAELAARFIEKAEASIKESRARLADIEKRGRERAAKSAKGVSK